MQTCTIIGSSLTYQAFIHTVLHSTSPKIHPYVKHLKYLPRMTCKLVFLNQEQLRFTWGFKLPPGCFWGAESAFQSTVLGILLGSYTGAGMQVKLPREWRGKENNATSVCTIRLKKYPEHCGWNLIISCLAFCGSLVFFCLGFFLSQKHYESTFESDP